MYDKPSLSFHSKSLVSWRYGRIAVMRAKTNKSCLNDKQLLTIFKTFVQELTIIPEVDIQTAYNLKNKELALWSISA